ncbi:hypothetical protein [Francisella sp. TX07-6608]|uniref:hypothetical protein n=1 Tax=Francisella sp. TX07-6608 TaxID=573568 RepID=UPI0008F9DB8A|nr:hypothetical protein [Francisella sp. TX07-6608]OIN82936.1 hypothetical protein KX00_2014 [Francisella sp. TX07-6608]
MRNKKTKGKSKQFKPKLKSKYADFTEAEVLDIKADSQKLVNYLQEKYGMTKEDAEKEAKSIEMGIYKH